MLVSKTEIDEPGSECPGRRDNAGRSRRSRAVSVLLVVAQNVSVDFSDKTGHAQYPAIAGLLRQVVERDDGKVPGVFRKRANECRGAAFAGPA